MVDEKGLPEGTWRGRGEDALEFGVPMRTGVGAPWDSGPGARNSMHINMYRCGAQVCVSTLDT